MTNKIFEELYNTASITSKSRYEASRRMNIQHISSQWTLTLLAVGQILLTLVIALDLHYIKDDDTLNLGGIFFSIMLLAYSLLLGISNFQLRSKQLHRCGIELSNIAKKAAFHINSNGQSINKYDYDKLVKEYSDCLMTYENHSQLDYLLAKLHHGEKFEKITFSNPDKIFLKFEIMIRIFFRYIHYGISFIMLILWSYVLIDFDLIWKTISGLNNYILVLEL